MLKPLNDSMSRLLDTLTANLADPSTDGQSGRKYDNAPEVYMAVYVNRLTENRFSVAHFYLQNGDRVPDPDMEFVKVDGLWFPVCYTNCYGRREAVVTDENGRPSRYSPREYAGLRTFANVLLRNIREQQEIKVPRKKAA